MLLISRAPILRPAGVALAIIVVAALSPGRAKAECGDYVHIVGGQQMTDGSTAAGDATTHLGDQDVPRLPCHGPNCSSNPSTPTLPLTAPVMESTHAKEWAARITGGGDQPDGSCWYFPTEVRNVPISRPNPIFHPPRAV